MFSIGSIVSAAVLSTVTINGDVTDDEGDYVIVPFEVVEGALEIEIARTVNDEENILDFGVWSPDGFRGWGGGLTDNAIIGVSESSRGYAIGPLTAGTWSLVIGKAKLEVVPAGYSLTVTMRDDATLPVRVRSDFEDTALSTGERWYAGDFHVHSSESGDAPATLAEIVGLASSRQLDFVVLSDHNTVSQHALAEAFQAQAPSVLLIRGNEVTTYGGHGNALGVAVAPDHRVGLDGRTRAAIIEEVNAGGGLFVVNHPTLALGPSCIGCGWDEPETTPWASVAAIEIHTGPYVTAELFSKSARALWDQVQNDGNRVVAIGGSDDHRAGINLSPTQSPIGSPTTLVRATELSESAILAGLAAGRAVVLHRGPGDARVDLVVETDRGNVGGIGDEVVGGRVSISASVTGGAGSIAVLFRDGQDIETVSISSNAETATFEASVAPTGSRFRVHLLEGVDLVTVTNHVYVEYAEPEPEPEPEADGGCGCQTGLKLKGGASGWNWFALVALGFFVACRRRKS